MVLGLVREVIRRISNTNQGLDYGVTPLLGRDIEISRYGTVPIYAVTLRQGSRWLETMMGVTIRSQHTGVNPELPDCGMGKSPNSTLHTSPIPETANPAIPPEQPIDEDVVHAEDDSHTEDLSDAEDHFLVSITH